MLSSYSRFLSPIVIIGLIVGAVAGLGVEYALTQPTIQQLNATVNRLQTNLTSSQITINMLEDEREKLESELNSTEAQLNAKEAELGKALSDLRGNQTELIGLQQRLELIQDAITRLDNDRILLTDLRRDIPSTREEARTFWQGVKTRAEQVDRTLVISVQDVLDKLDNWFDWVARLNNATTAEEFGVLYVQAFSAGAFDYGDAITKFQQDTLLVVISHIDQVVSLLT